MNMNSTALNIYDVDSDRHRYSDLRGFTKSFACRVILRYRSFCHRDFCIFVHADRCRLKAAVMLYW
ncbi:unnamed protein product [Amoebophrya sp. A25]|nr:unnamed protein product [Amoebophrya sp. A25]|eukprot:GSA25T00017499001.1